MSYTSTSYTTLELPPLPPKDYPGLGKPSTQSSLRRVRSKESVNTTRPSSSRSRGLRPARHEPSLSAAQRKTINSWSEKQVLEEPGTDPPSAISKPVRALSPPFRPLELQIHADGRSLSPMLNFTLPVSLKAGQHQSSSSLLPEVIRRQRSLSAPNRINPDLTDYPDLPTDAASIAKRASSRSHTVPASKFKTTDNIPHGTPELREHLVDDLIPVELEEKVVVLPETVRSQSFYAHAGALLLASTLEVKPAVPDKKGFYCPKALSPAPSPRAPQWDHVHASKARNESQRMVRESRSLNFARTPELAAPSPKFAETPGCTASPVELDTNEECFRARAERLIQQPETASPTSKSRRKSQPRDAKPPTSPRPDCPSRTDSLAKTATTFAESRHNSATSFDTMASATSLSSMNSGLVITDEKFIRAGNTDFELIHPTSANRTIHSASSSISTSTLKDLSMPAPMPRAYVRKQLNVSRSADSLTPLLQPSRPNMTRRSKTLHHSSNLSPSLERLGTVGMSHMVKASPRLVSIGEGREPRRVAEVQQTEWGRGLGVEFGVVYWVYWTSCLLFCFVACIYYSRYPPALILISVQCHRLDQRGSQGTFVSARASIVTTEFSLSTTILRAGKLDGRLGKNGKHERSEQKERSDCGAVALLFSFLIFWISRDATTLMIMKWWR